MNKAILTIIFLFMFGIASTKGQITLDSTDFGSVGDTVVLVRDSIPSSALTVGGSGANQSWDLTAMQFNYLDTIIFLHPDSTADSVSFEGADMATKNLLLTVYYNFDTAGIDIVGTTGDALSLGYNLYLRFNDPQQIFKFPAAYEDSFSDIGTIDTTVKDIYTGASDSLRVKRDIVAYSKMDGYGSVATPAGTYNNSIRQHYREITTDSIWGGKEFLGIMFWTLVYNQTDSSHTYSWYIKGGDYAIAEIRTDSADGVPVSANFMLDSTVAALITYVSNVSCTGNCDGSAVVIPMNGMLPYTYKWSDPASQAMATATGLCEGAYTVKVIDAMNDTATASLMIAEPSALSAIISAKTNASCDTCKDGSLTATASGGSPVYTFLWNDPSSKTGPVAGGLAPGKYNVTVTDSKGCIYITSDSVGFTVGISELANLQHFMLYPNPVTRQITVINTTGEEGEIIIFNIIGKQIFTMALQKGANYIDTGIMSKGVYVYRINSKRYGNPPKTGKLTVIKS